MQPFVASSGTVENECLLLFSRLSRVLHARGAMDGQGEKGKGNQEQCEEQENTY